MPALAFALPLTLPQPTEARPLATPVPEARWCWDDGGDGCDDGGGGDETIDIEFELLLCVGVILGEEPHENRACEVRSGPACLSACTFEAVGPGCLAELGDRARPRDLAVCKADSVATCRSQCEAGGAAFCAERGKPGGGPPPGKGHCKGGENQHVGHIDDCGDKDDHHDYDKDDHDDHDHDDHDDHDDDDDDDGGGGGGNTIVFIDLLACIGIDLDFDLDRDAD